MVDLGSTPEQLWPLVSDTNRFNRDAGVPAVESLGVESNARRRLRLRRLGVEVEWEEQPFEWVSPHRFSVERAYVRGPVASMRTSAALEPRDGGTRLVYDVHARPRNLLGRLAIPVQVGLLSRRRFRSVFRAYDAAVRGGVEAPPPGRPHLAPGAPARIAAARTALVATGASSESVDRLCTLVEQGDELSLVKLRPYVLADAWAANRRATLELCLQATRQGLLELRWELLCPRCRGSAASEATLESAGRQVHCDTCRIDFTADFERSVELAFRPTAAIRPIAHVDFCVAGPQVQPHVVAQQLVPVGGACRLDLRLEPGGYRLRSFGVDGDLPVTVERGGGETSKVVLEAAGWPAAELRVGERATLELENATGAEQLLVLERTAWSDRVATAAEVTALQAYRDLFAAEALRAGEPISVGTLTVVFTDLRGSTRYYRDVGDAPAFGSVLVHLDELRRCGGGRAAARSSRRWATRSWPSFPRPVGAVEAMLAAQETVAGKPLSLKVGIHTGPCIAVSQNGRARLLRLDGQPRGAARHAVVGRGRHRLGGSARRSRGERARAPVGARRGRAQGLRG